MAKPRSPGENVAKARFVYVVVRGPFVKVGISSRPKQRASALRLSSPEELEVASVFSPTGNKTAREIEIEAHRLLAPWHSRGEWFRCSQRIADLAIQQADASAPGVEDFLQSMAAYEKLSDAAFRIGCAMPRSSRSPLHAEYQDRYDKAEAASYAAWKEIKEKHPELLDRAGGAL